LDSKLLSQAADLARQEEDLLLEIATLRREAPVKVAEAWKAIGRDDDGVLKAFASRLTKDIPSTKVCVKVDLGLQMMKRHDEMEKTWKRGVEGLERLKMEMPGTAAIMDSARRAGEYLRLER